MFFEGQKEVWNLLYPSNNLISGIAAACHWRYALRVPEFLPKKSIAEQIILLTHLISPSSYFS
jgi:hypothetical protein